MTKIKLFATDIDGTLTDGCMYYGDDGTEFKRFNFKDGMGFQLLREAGIKTAFVTSENTPIVTKRAAKLKVDFVQMGSWKKLEFVQDICQKMGISLQEVAYIGDDINDLELLKAAGVKACPQDAVAAVKQVPDIRVLTAKGGEGAVREFIEYLLEGN
ncbi:MAG: HAD-IIIA family hydrolase [Elusimicrobiaceae bacterium]|nr:HAD-IIIA family hydrolase [Elusimicrobiaceae bacterium]